MELEFTEAQLKQVMSFMDKIPFSNFLGLETVKVDANEAVFRFAMRDELVGNWLQGILHGGMISTALDAAGGTVALAGAYARQSDLSEQQQLANLSKLGTIDIRIDYLRPGKGKEFFASASILRIGNKVAVTRMEFKNEKDDLIAVGTGTYLCG